MSKIGTLFACMALLTFGCDDTRPMDDGGGIVLMDSGPRTDSGPVGVDSGGGTTFPTSCSISGFMPLPASCTPRCTAASGSAAAACADAACIRSALEADPTPAATVTGPGGSASIDCWNCFLWQIQTCWAESCPTQFDAWNMCGAMMGADCTAQETALDSCIMTNGDAITACANPRVDQCFARSSGFLPDFEPRQFRVDLGRYVENVDPIDPSLF